MAGYTCQRDTQQYQDILASIDNNALINCCTYGNEHRSFFDTNRLISAYEIQSATSKLNGNNAGLTFSDTTAISAEDITTKNIPQNLLSTLLNIDENGNQTPSVGHFIPLLIRDHWVLFGLSTTNTGQKTAVMFDSQDSLKPEEVDFLRTLADFAGAEHFLPVSAPLQHHAPNACAVFVCHAMSSIAKDPTAPADETLQAFVESFLALTDEEQARFNKHGRAELYGNVLDTLSLDRGGDWNPDIIPAPVWLRDICHLCRVVWFTLVRFFASRPPLGRASSAQPTGKCDRLSLAVTDVMPVDVA